MSVDYGDLTRVLYKVMYLQSIEEKVWLENRRKPPKRHLFLAVRARAVGEKEARDDGYAERNTYPSFAKIATYYAYKEYRRLVKDDDGKRIIIDATYKTLLPYQVIQGQKPRPAAAGGMYEGEVESWPAKEKT